ncbi:MAG: hypothetical protein HQ526_02875 [Actinobacteria bacterium]|nr:hypothetical protein [Actinomycetota bacterium]
MVTVNLKLLLLAPAALLALSACSDVSYDRSSFFSSTGGTAYESCEEAVAAELGARDVEFPSKAAAREQADGDQHAFDTYVDFRNNGGEMERAEFRCVATEEGGVDAVKFLTIDGELVIDNL